MKNERGSLRERIAVLETNQGHMGEQIDTMADQLTEIHAVLLQAKGARWVLISTAIAIGFAIANLKSLAQLLALTK
jgi:hypothetical protein